MKRKKDSTKYLYSRPIVQPSQRHKRMLERSLGWVWFGSSPAPALASNHSEVRRREHKKVWKLPHRMSQYLGCTRRHLYWLIQKWKFPYHLTGSLALPRYVFEVGEVNIWLSGYRGKGRQLGLRKLRIRENLGMPQLNWKGTGKHR